MAKKKTADETTNQPEGNGQEGGESTAGYFRRIFKENPKLLGERSNEKLLSQWLADHPEQTEVPKNIKANLSNLKSVLRSKNRTKVAQDKEQENEQVVDREITPVARVASGSSDLEVLELQIDECLILAKQLDREGLENVINHLRKARNEVVWKIGM